MDIFKLGQSAVGSNAALFLIIRRKGVSVSQGGTWIMNRGYIEDPDLILTLTLEALEFLDVVG